MAVYVDDMRVRYGRMVMCHMIADTDAELRLMAQTIGVSERHHQGDHFDICLAKRAMAIRFGAVSISRRQAAAMRRRRAIEGSLGTPEDALRWFYTERATKPKSKVSGNQRSQPSLQ